jgi:hypothetical protein
LLLRAVARTPVQRGPVWPVRLKGRGRGVQPQKVEVKETDMEEEAAMQVTAPISVVTLDDDAESIRSAPDYAQLDNQDRDTDRGGELEQDVDYIVEVREALMHEHERAQGELMGLMERLRGEGTDSQQFHYLKKHSSDAYPANPYVQHHPIALGRCPVQRRAIILVVSRVHCAASGPVDPFAATSCSVPLG